MRGVGSVEHSLALGEDRSSAAKVRFIAATHQDLTALRMRGAFREDLYARLAVLSVVAPPLRERKEDLGLLVGSILRRIAPERAGSVSLHRRVARALFLYEWPHNIRELENLLRAALVLTTGDTIEPGHIAEELRALLEDGGGEDAEPIEPAMRERLLAALEKYDGNVSAVARELGKSRTQIHRWVRRLDIDLGKLRRR
jgi:DNA-binding NtrC family response regulator